MDNSSIFLKSSSVDSNTNNTISRSVFDFQTNTASTINLVENINADDIVQSIRETVNQDTDTKISGLVDKLNFNDMSSMFNYLMIVSEAYNKQSIEHQKYRAKYKAQKMLNIEQKNIINKLLKQIEELKRKNNQNNM